MSLAMRSQLQIESTDQYLLVRMKASANLPRIGLVVAAGAIFFLLALRSSAVSRTGFLLGSLLGGAVILSDIISSARGTNVQLKVQNLNFFSRGHAPGGYRPCQVSRDDLMKLEFRPASGGGEDPELPSGLYVEYDSDSVRDTRACVLPNITEEQTQKVIDAIRKQFPEIDQITCARFKSSGLISLNLSR